MGEAARQVFEREYTAALMAERTAALYAEAVEAGRSQSARLR